LLTEIIEGVIDEDEDEEIFEEEEEADGVENENPIKVEGEPAKAPVDNGAVAGERKEPPPLHLGASRESEPPLPTLPVPCHMSGVDRAVSTVSGELGVSPHVTLSQPQQSHAAAKCDRSVCDFVHAPHQIVPYSDPDARRALPLSLSFGARSAHLNRTSLAHPSHTRLFVA